MAQATAERRLQKTHIHLMRTPEFALYSGLLMVGTSTVSETFPSAATDGRNKIYGRQFVNECSDKELAFIVIHEAMHVAFRHLTVWRALWKINPQITNMACDYVINLLIVDADPTEKVVAFPMRDGKHYGLYDVRFRGMNTKQVFDILMKEQQDKPEGNGRQPGKGYPGDGQGEGQPGEGDSGNFDSHDWDGAAGLSDEEAKQLEREVDQALRQGVINQQKAGKGSGKMPRELGDLLAPQLDWRDLLREFAVSACAAKDTSSWRRINRRFIGEDIYMPSLIGEKVRKVFVGADASGSTFISPTTFNTFMSEIKAICETVSPDCVELVYWDTRITGHETYEASNLGGLITSTQPKGGGGTDPSCVEAYMTKENITPDCIIVLTDGYVPNWGKDWNAPILWVIAGNPNAQATTGKTIHIND
jgi:predicted metal-dependent peptidase